MERRDSKISFSKSGNGIGAKITFSMPLLRKIGITPENKEVEVIYDEEEEKIIILKKK